MVDFKANHWALLDLQYEYLDDGFKLTATTDVPCHLYCRMTTTPPRKHTKASPRRGTYWVGDIRFCFVVYEDNDQQEAGDTYIHTWLKGGWPVCETRWFYFVGEQGGTASVSETGIFKFHFPAPPPEPPPPMERQFNPDSTNRTIRSSWGTWPPTRNGIGLTIMAHYALPWAYLTGGYYHVISWWLHRCFLKYPTYTLPWPARIQEATLSIFGVSNPFGSPTYPHLCITRGYQSDPVVVNDWYAQNTVTTILGQIDVRDIVIGAYNDVPFNEAGLLYLATPGEKKFCLSGENDIVNVVPPLMSQNYGNFNSYQKGLGYRPILKIKYFPA